MNGKSHGSTTAAAFDLLVKIDSNFENWLFSSKAEIVNGTIATDQFRDLEFVDVEGSLPGADHLDNPHDSEFSEDDDMVLKEDSGKSFTAFNHFIDIKKGPGEFDDFDGYSYSKGSASRDQYQDASDATSGGRWLLAKTSGMKLDEGVMWGLNDDYVHAPGHKWYQHCSPSIEHYSFYGDRGTYSSIEAEAKARFPRADWVGKTGMGIPYSVFMPVDNMARYWFTRFTNTLDPRALGPVLHALQDASIPHHAAGYLGNWHAEYEDKVDAEIEAWLSDPSTTDLAVQRFLEWRRNDPQPAISLNVSDWSKTPALNWRIDMLVTWQALNAYRSYERVYNHFRKGFYFDEQDARQLTIQALAGSMLILATAANIPNCAYLTENSLAKSTARIGIRKPFSWSKELSGYPKSLHALLYVLNSTYPDYQATPFP